MPEFIHIPTGKKFGKWRVVGFAESRAGTAYWDVICACGALKTIAGSRLRSGKVKGCRSCAMMSHGMCGTSTYRAWKGLITRTGNPKGKNWKDYGGRGITLARRWLSFENFFTDMGECPPGLTLERSDNEKGYCKSNCVWATRSEQCRNRRSNRMVSYLGRSMTLVEASELSGLKYMTLLSRLNRSPSSDIFQPLRKK